MWNSCWWFRGNGCFCNYFCAVYKPTAYSGDPIGSTVPESDCAWRIVLMLGALPAALNLLLAHGDA